MAMVKKYKVVHPGVRFILDVREMIVESTKEGKGMLQPLSATCGEYLDEKVAIKAEFNDSLNNGLLGKFISEGKIVPEMVEESREEGPKDPYANINLPREQDEEISFIKPNVPTTQTHDWNKMTIEQKRSLMRNEEIQEEQKKKIEAEKPPQVDWNKLTLEEKKALMKKEEEAEILKQQTPPIVDWNSLTPAQRKELMKKEEEAELALQKSVDEMIGVNGVPGVVKAGDKIEVLDGKDKGLKGEVVKVAKSVKKVKAKKAKKGKRIKAGDLVQTVKKDSNGTVEMATALMEPATVKESDPNEIESYEQFDSLKYMEQISFIAQATNPGLLSEIANKSTRDQIISRAMKRARVLRG